MEKCFTPNPPLSQAHASPLVALPNEILLQIFECLVLCSHTDNASLHGLFSLSVTSRYLHTFAMKYLYRGSPNKMMPLMHRLLYTPSLTEHLRGIYFPYSDRQECDPFQSDGPQNVNTDILANISCFRDNQSLDPEWIQLLQYYPREVLLAWVIAHTPKLQTLDLSGIISQNLSQHRSNLIPIYLEPLLHASWRLSATEGHMYDKLTSLSINMQYQSVCPSRISRLLLLPSLVSFGIYCLRSWPRDEITRNEADWPIEPKSSTVSSIRLSQCSLSLIHLKLLLASCKAVESFASLDGQYPTANNDERALTTLFLSLGDHRNRLRSLNIDSMMTLNMHEGIYRPRYDLKDHCCLTSLSIPFHHLMGGVNRNAIASSCWSGYPDMRRVLPPSLKFLAITVDQKWFPSSGSEGHFLSLLPNNCSLDIPLRELHITYNYIFDDGDHQFPLQSGLDFPYLENQFRDSGISFTWEVNYNMHDFACDEDFPTLLISKLAELGQRGLEIARHTCPLYSVWEIDDIGEAVRAEIEKQQQSI
ncbi:hypothetical protein BCR34DRAFT_35059 [Clohesyomyces aquaticus]|uniref:Uncharacterized protein n=1 Tax=Clohesyomyces aquaticus TaxID=1231657 RepID=A0A1Y1Z7F0_9PLEO|nr:hypothetical protein BCR34DRAFT_35059 [Clohesyomyces aquaticus]